MPERRQAVILLAIESHRRFLIKALELPEVTLAKLAGSVCAQRIIHFKLLLFDMIVFGTAHCQCRRGKRHDNRNVGKANLGRKSSFSWHAEFERMRWMHGIGPQEQVWKRIINSGIFLVVQWLRICPAMQGTWVQSLVGALRFHMPGGNKA